MQIIFRKMLIPLIIAGFIFSAGALSADSAGTAVQDKSVSFILTPGFWGSIVSTYTESPPGGEKQIWGTLNTLNPYIRGDLFFGHFFGIRIMYQQGFILPADMYLFGPNNWTQIGGHTENVYLFGIFRIIILPAFTLETGIGASFMHVLKTFTDYIEAGSLQVSGDFGYFRMLFPSPRGYLGLSVRPAAILSLGADADGSPFAVIFNEVKNADGLSHETKFGWTLAFKGWAGIHPGENFVIRGGYRQEFHYFRAPSPSELDLKLNLGGPFVETAISF